MKKFTIEVSHAAPGQLATIAAELKIMSNGWTKYGPRIRPQAWAAKRQAASHKLDKAWALGYSGIMKTFIFENITYEFKNMEEANTELPLGDGAWFGPEEGMPANTYKWEKGNFFD